jgi:hypothetical protein
MTDEPHDYTDKELDALYEAEIQKRMQPYNELREALMRLAYAIFDPLLSWLAVSRLRLWLFGALAIWMIPIAVWMDYFEGRVGLADPLVMMFPSAFCLYLWTGIVKRHNL